jgi:hypothetical protein
MQNTMIFELPSVQEAIYLREHLEPARLCHIDFEDETWRVLAAFGPAPDDFALLLRAVEEWVADWEIGAIRIHVDERAYVLAATEVSQEAAAA